MANFWTKAPKIGPKPSGWRPGEARVYTPELTFGRPENMPAGGLVGKTVNMDGDKRVSFIVRGPKTGSTK